jgi:hypothetical protein
MDLPATPEVSALDQRQTYSDQYAVVYSYKDVGMWRRV